MSFIIIIVSFKDLTFIEFEKGNSRNSLETQLEITHNKLTVSHWHFLNKSFAENPIP